MNEVLEKKPASVKALPARLHHHAYVVLDQRRTRAFYEDVLGMPLVQFWIEDTTYQGDRFVLSHAMYGLADGSALAFFCMSTPELHEKYKSPKSEVFNHVALKVEADVQDALLKRLEDAGYQNFHIEHGYCQSLYVVDPDGLMLEFTLDSPKADVINDIQRKTAHETLERWANGDRKSNNNWREE